MEHDGKQQHIPALCIFSLFDHVHVGGGALFTASSQMSDTSHSPATWIWTATFVLHFLTHIFSI